MKKLLVLLVVCSGLGFTANGWADPAADGFSLKDEAGKYLDVIFGGKVLGRFMYAYDTSTGDKRTETYKPYLHVFDADGKAPITKGSGGQYTHHRGIFIGWNKITVDGKEYDRWHMKGGEQVHQKFIAQEADVSHATVTSLVLWTGATAADKPIIEEERTMTFRRAPAPAYALIDFTSKLKAVAGDVTLDGDPEHAGVHFRAANEVDTKQTMYVYPKEKAKPHADLDYPWVGETYVLGDKHYSVVEMNHPDNPKGTKFSAYRDYARFGAFCKAGIKSGETLTVKYRFLVAEGEMPPVEMIQKNFNEFAGVSGDVPKTTVMRSEQPAPPKEQPGTPAPAPAPAQNK